MNKVIRNYHGHLSGVYCLKVHQDLGVLITGGRDSTARVWDIRIRRQIHALTGHSHTVGSVLTQEH
jgi:pleiotropic regulator 1